MFLGIMGNWVIFDKVLSNFVKYADLTKNIYISGNIQRATSIPDSRFRAHPYRKL